MQLGNGVLWVSGLVGGSIVKIKKSRRNCIATGLFKNRTVPQQSGRTMGPISKVRIRSVPGVVGTLYFLAFWVCSGECL